jgi:hypothetical protein
MVSANYTDHRWSQRRPLQHELVIHREGSPLDGRLRNISIGGVFVETDVSTLSQNQLVHVMFKQVDVDSAAADYRFPANVIWTGERGVGLMFVDFSPKTLRALRELVADGPGSPMVRLIR